MKKTKGLKALALLMALVMVSNGLTACGGNKKTEKSTAQSQSAGTSEKEASAQSQSADTNEGASAGSTAGSATESTVGSTAGSATGSTAENTAESTAEKLKAILSIGYAGVDSHDSTVYWALSAAGDYGVLLVVSADETQKVSFVGDIASEGSQMTVTDASSGNSKTVDVQETPEGERKGIILTDEEGDQTLLYPVEVDKVIDAMIAADMK